ncbi:hypothetical protein N42HA_00265 [Lactococcus lactis]|nr:hypothetical protein [Lactococcus lactis]
MIPGKSFNLNLVWILVTMISKSLDAADKQTGFWLNGVREYYAEMYNFKLTGKI